MLKIILVFSLRWSYPRHTSEKYIKHYNNTLQSILNFKLDLFSDNQWIIKNIDIYSFQQYFHKYIEFFEITETWINRQLNQVSIMNQDINKACNLSKRFNHSKMNKRIIKAMKETNNGRSKHIDFIK